MSAAQSPRQKSKEGRVVKNKVSVNIAGLEYTLVASEDASYMERVAQHVDAKVN